MKRSSSSRPSGASSAKKNKEDEPLTRLEHVRTPVVKYALENLYGHPFNNQTGNYKVKRVNQRYVSDLARELDTHNVMVVRSPMGSGKTAMFLNAIKSYDRVLIVSCRRSYSSYMCTVVPGLVNYQNIKGAISAEEHPRVIIQLQSLKRIRAIKTETTYAQWDLVYIDEPNGVFNELLSPVTAMQERKDHAKYLRKLVSNIPTVIVTDAGLAPWHLDAIDKHLLSGLTRCKRVCVVNEYTHKTHHMRVFDSLLMSCSNYSTVFCPKLKKVLGKEEAYIMEAENFFASKHGSAAKGLFVSLTDRAYRAHKDDHDGDMGAYFRHLMMERGENAMVLCNTRNQANLMAAFANRLVGEDKVVVLTGNTAAEVKQSFMADPQDGLRGKRVLVHTTCVSVGVDFNFDWATETFVVVDRLTCKHTPCVIDIFQGLGRNRRTTTINLFVHNRRKPLNKQQLMEGGIAADHMIMVKLDAVDDGTLWRPSIWSDFQLQSDVMEDSLDAAVFKSNKLERSFNKSPRLFFDVLVGLLNSTSLKGDIEYRPPTWEASHEFLTKESHVEKAVEACRLLFAKNITKYTTLTLQSFNEIFRGKPSADRKDILRDIVAILGLFKGDFASSFFVLRHLNKHLLKQWAIKYSKLQYIEPTGAVDMLKFDDEAAAVVDPDELIIKVKKRLFRNNRTTSLRTYSDFDSVVEHSHAILDGQHADADRLQALTRLLVDEYEISMSRHKVLKSIAQATGMTLYTESGQDPSESRFIMPTVPLKADIHKMAALLLL